MGDRTSVLIVSDIHFAGASEKAFGHPRKLLRASPAAHLLMRAWDRFIWMRDPLAHNSLLDRFLDHAPEPEIVVANGDFACDSACVGVSNDACLASARECLAKLRGRFGGRFLATIGDHELGKLSLVGGMGGMRLASWDRAVGELSLRPAWSFPIGRYVLIGVTSTLLAWPVYRRDSLAHEVPDWTRLQEEHWREVRSSFAALRSDQRVILFCHDPTALPYLWEEPVVRAKVAQIERTVIGHLHSPLMLRQGRLMAGMPAIGFLGHSVRRMSTALNRARYWKPFNILLCPSLAGIELLKDGGYYSVRLDPKAMAPAEFQFHPLKRMNAQ